MDRAQKVDEKVEWMSSYIIVTPRVTVIKMSKITHFCIFY